jgi:hypothetical protein
MPRHSRVVSNTPQAVIYDPRGYLQNWFHLQCWQVILGLPELWLIYIGYVFTTILSVTQTRDCHYLLALAILGRTTEIGSFLLAKVSKKGVIMLAISHATLHLTLPM